MHSQPRNPGAFFEVLHRCGALQRLLPELAEGMVSGGHGEETGDEFAAPLKRVANESEDPVVRCGVALFGAVSRLAQPDQWMRQLRIEKAGRQLLHDLLRFHRLSQEPEQAEQILRFVATLNPKRQPVRFRRFVAASHGLWPQHVENLLPKLEYSAELLGSPMPEELVRSGLEGQALGEALFAWRVVRLEEVMSQTRGSN